MTLVENWWTPPLRLVVSSIQTITPLGHFYILFISARHKCLIRPIRNTFADYIWKVSTLFNFSKQFLSVSRGKRGERKKTKDNDIWVLLLYHTNINKTFVNVVVLQTKKKNKIKIDTPIFVGKKIIFLLDGFTNCHLLLWELVNKLNNNFFVCLFDNLIKFIFRWFIWERESFRMCMYKKETRFCI